MLQNLDDTVKGCKNNVYFKIEAHYRKLQGTKSNRKSARPLTAELREEVAQECGVIYQWLQERLSGIIIVELEMNWPHFQEWEHSGMNRGVISEVHSGRRRWWHFKWNGSFTRGVEHRLWTTKTTGMDAALIACTASSWLAFCKSTPETYLSHRMTEGQRTEGGQKERDKEFKGDMRSKTGLFSKKQVTMSEPCVY